MLEAPDGNAILRVCYLGNEGFMVQLSQHNKQIELSAVDCSTNL